MSCFHHAVHSNSNRLTSPKDCTDASASPIGRNFLAIAGRGHRCWAPREPPALGKPQDLAEVQQVLELRRMSTEVQQVLELRRMSTTKSKEEVHALLSVRNSLPVMATSQQVVHPVSSWCASPRGPSSTRLDERSCARR